MAVLGVEGTCLVDVKVMMGREPQEATGSLDPQRTAAGVADVAGVPGTPAIPAIPLCLLGSRLASRCCQPKPCLPHHRLNMPGPPRHRRRSLWVLRFFLRRLPLPTSGQGSTNNEDETLYPQPEDQGFSLTCVVNIDERSEDHAVQQHARYLVPGQLAALPVQPDRYWSQLEVWWAENLQSTVSDSSATPTADSQDTMALPKRIVKETERLVKEP